MFWSLLSFRAILSMEPGATVESESVLKMKSMDCS